MKPVEFPKHVTAIRLSAPELASLQKLADHLADGNRSRMVRDLVADRFIELTRQIDLDDADDLAGAGGPESVTA